MARTKAFAYDTLMRIRKRQEELRAMDLATAQRDVRDAEEQRAALAEEQREALGRWAELLHSALDTTSARRYHQYERHLARLIDEKDADIRQLGVKAEEKRAHLMAATKRKRIVEKLKERKNAAYALYLRREMQRAIDEIATNYASRSDSLAHDDSKR